MKRSDFFGGPAYFTHDSVTWQARDDQWTAGNEIVLSEERSNLQGYLGSREDHSITRITATPIAFTSALATAFGKLIPKTGGAGDIGSLLFPSTDLPFVIQTKDGKSITFSAGAMSRPPTLQFAAGRPLFGEAEWTCLRKDDTAASNAAAHVAVASSAYSEPSIDPSGIVNTTYTLAWGESSTPSPAK